MRENWRRRALIGTLCTAGILGVSGCGGRDPANRSTPATESQTYQQTGTPAQTTAYPRLVQNRTELSWFVQPGALFEKEHYGVYIYDIPRLREYSQTLQGQPLVALDVTSDDVSHLGIDSDQIDSVVKLDGVKRSEAEVVMFFGSFDASSRPSIEGEEIVSTAEYQEHTLYRLSASGGDIGIAVGPQTIILASDTAKKDPLGAVRSTIGASLGEVPRYQDVHSGFADMLDALWDGAITVVGTHESYRNSVRTNPETRWDGSIGLGGSVRLGPEMSDIRLGILYPSAEEAKTRRDSVARHARKSDETSDTSAEQTGNVVVLTGKRATPEISV